MRVEALKNHELQGFVDYCRKHRSEIDESFLYDEDLKNFKISEENPTYIIKNEGEEIKAAASLIIDEYFRRGKKGRFRVFHSEIKDAGAYIGLMESILRHTEGLEKLFIFIPLANEELMKQIEGMKFSVDRYAFFLLREDIIVPEFSFPEGYEIRPFVIGRDEEIFCQVRNSSFATLRGSETPITPEMVEGMISSDENIEGGIMILYHGEKPVGVVRGAKDEYENVPAMYIGPLAIIPEYQGRGLGRSMLRAALKFAGEKNYKRVVLSVNAENEGAKKLYLKEGFKQVDAVVCYRYDL